MDNIKKAIIYKFLIEIKNLISQGKFRFAGERTINIEFLHKYGLTIDDIKEIIYDLKPENHKRGPTSDHKDYDGTVWEFNYVIELSEDIEIYI